MVKKEPLKTQLRLSASLHLALTEAAAKSGRSMNAEIVYRLRQSFTARLYSPFVDEPPEAIAGDAEQTAAERGIISIAQLGLALKDAGKLLASLEESYEEVSGMRTISFSNDDSDEVFEKNLALLKRLRPAKIDGGT